MKPEKSRKRPIDSARLRLLRKLVEDVGESRVLAVMEVQAQTLYRALAGLPLQSGTRAVVDKAIAQLRGAA